eukprot:7891635-Pyramimonas_sp.AAC.1
MELGGRVDCNIVDAFWGYASPPPPSPTPLPPPLPAQFDTTMNTTLLYPLTLSGIYAALSPRIAFLLKISQVNVCPIACYNPLVFDGPSEWRFCCSVGLILRRRFAPIV